MTYRLFLFCYVIIFQAWANELKTNYARRKQIIFNLSGCYVCNGLTSAKIIPRQIEEEKEDKPFFVYKFVILLNLSFFTKFNSFEKNDQMICYGFNVHILETRQNISGEKTLVRLQPSSFDIDF